MLSGSAWPAAIVALAIVLPACVEGANTASDQGVSGHSQDTAIKVDGIQEEYQWIKAHRPGWTPVEQALVVDHDRRYDIISIKRGNQTQQVWFDINSFFGFGL